jgi:Gas vesicle protein
VTAPRQLPQAASSVSRAATLGSPPRDTLADVLERVLDKGVVIVGDIVVSLLDIDLLTLKLRLFISSADTAQRMGLDWWSGDPFFSGQRQDGQQQDGQREVRGRGERRAVQDGNPGGSDELEDLRARVAELESRLPQAQPAADGKGDSA